MSEREIERTRANICRREGGRGGVRESGSENCRYRAPPEEDLKTRCAVELLPEQISAEVRQGLRELASIADIELLQRRS